MSNASKYISIGNNADSIPYDSEEDPNCKLTSDTVQEAIDALCVNNPANSLVSVQVLMVGSNRFYIHAAQLVCQTPAFLRANVVP